MNDISEFVTIHDATLTTPARRMAKRFKKRHEVALSATKGNASVVGATEASSVKNQVLTQGIDMKDSKATGAEALSFNSIRFDALERAGRVWLKAVEIGRALGYVDDKAVQRIYARHAEEFSQEMTGVVKLTTPSGKQGSRVFSLRGAHLLAMFARTSVAKAFRKWVLDVLDREVERQAQGQAGAVTLIPGHDQAFRQLVISTRRKMVATLADFEKKMAEWEIVDEQERGLLPEAQMREITTRLDRLSSLFHPASAQFVDAIGIGRALRGLHPKLSMQEPGWVQVIPRIGQSTLGIAA